MTAIFWWWVGELPEAFRLVEGEAAVKCCGVAVAMSQGSSRVPPPAERSMSEHGNRSWSALVLRSRRGRGAGLMVG